MKNQALFISIISLVLLLTPVSAQTTEFVYQGQLKDASVPANGSYDFEFLLFDTLGGSTQIGSTLTRSNVTVTDGIFAVKLDFGSVFPGANRYLEIRVRLAGQPGITTLAPRQLMTSAPYSVKSINADNATNATQLGGVAANQYVVTTDPRMTDARPPTAGSANYIQNQTAAPQASSNFNISGTGTANIFNAGTQFNIGASRVLSTAGNQNLFAGGSAGVNNTSGSANSFFGNSAGFSNTSGAFNSFFGIFAANLNTSGSFNSFFGHNAGFSNTTGGSNSFVGRDAGVTNTAGIGNTIIGSFADVGANTLTNATAIGLRAFVTQSSSLVLGSIAGSNGATTSVNVGIGTTAPTQRLHVVGNSLFTGNVQVTGTISGALPAGSGSYIQNQSISTQPSSSFNISGVGTANILNAVTQLDIGGTRAFTLHNNRTNTFAGQNAGIITTMRSLDGAPNFGITGGISNSFFGNGSGQTNTNGSSNSFFGAVSGPNNTTGSENAFFGIRAGDGNFGGSGNSAFGSYARLGGSSLTNATAIGFRSSVTQDNSLVLGSIAGVNEAGATVKVGIGTTAPLASLDVRGSVFVGLTAPPSAPFLNSIFVANDNGNIQNSFRLDAADDNLFIVARSPVGSATGAGIIFRTGAAGGGESERVAINPNGTVRLNVLGPAGTSALCLNAFQQIADCSSSARYKSNINPFSLGLDIVRRLRPVSFNWREGGMLDMGLVAEEVAEIEPLLTTTNDKGEIEGVKYDRIGVVLVNAVNGQQLQIEKLAEQNRRQQLIIESLVTSICKKDPNDVVCQEEK